MKKLYNILYILGVGVLILASCVDTNTVPEGEYFTEDQKKEIAEAIPERLEADVNGMYAILGKQWPVFPASRRADDFGYPSVCLSADLNGSDMVSTDDGYNWFSTSSSFEDRTYNYSNPYIRWSLFYQQIKLANDVLAAIPEDTENETLKNYMGQALAIRAFDYLCLVQNYQFTYKGNEDKPSIPIVVLNMEDPSNNPRASVQDVYALIKADIDKAILLLEGFDATSKGVVDQQIAYGIRARMNLVMQNWGEAASDASKARAGFSFLSKDDVSKPGFNEIGGASWMWGIVINPSNIDDTYENWPSKMCSFAGNSYACVVGTYKSINSLIWKKIPSTDVRKGWWVDENLESPLIENLSWPGYEGQPIGPLSIKDVKLPYIPYTNVKFGPYNNIIGSTDNASDWVIMRSEEMLLIEAEAKAMGGDVPGAKTLLEEFVKTYRDEDYTCTASSPEEMQNEVWFQRRIELWGEGFAFWDIMRLKKNIVRYNSQGETSFPEKFKFNISADDGWLLMRIPQREINGNNGIAESDNNSGGQLPKSGDGAGLTDGVTD